MTAVFIYARDKVLFIAGDTRRGSSFSLMVQKVHSWGDNVILGQAGNGKQQSELISELRRKRICSAHNTEKVFSVFYKNCHAGHRANVKPPAQPNGAILVAALDPNATNPGLYHYNFEDGIRTVLSGHIATIGQDDVLLKEIANKRALEMQDRASFPLDEWAQLCIADAVRQFPDDVGWPCDLLIARPVPQGGRIIVERRIEANSAVGLSEFAATWTE